MKSVEEAAQIIYDELCYIYCDNCRYNSKELGDSGCDGCYRKYMNWEISMAESTAIARRILE